RVNLLQQVLRILVEAALRQPVSGKQVAEKTAGAVRASGVDIIKPRQAGIRKIAGAHCVRRRCADVIGGSDVAKTFVISEEESAVAAFVMRQSHRAAKGTAKLVLFKGRPNRIKEIAGV